jgi:hypothetical protein
MKRKKREREREEEEEGKYIYFNESRCCYLGESEGNGDESESNEELQNIYSYVNMMYSHK